MSFQEKRNITYLISSFLIFVGYAVYFSRIHHDGHLDSTNWGVLILLLIPIHIVVNVILHVILIVVSLITTQEDEPPFADELDKSIELRATRNSFYVFMIGFLLAMATTAGDLPQYVMFNVLILALFTIEVVWNVSQLYFYRRGF